MSVPINIFIIYAREDMDIKQRLLLHLNPFKNAFNAVIWHDGNIEAGQEWKPHIESRLEQTDLFLLLVSIDFMNSEFINQVEFKFAIDKHKAGKSIVVPIIINYCQWDIDILLKEYTFNLNELQVLPTEGRPIDDWKTPEQAYNNIAAGVRTVLTSIKNKREQERLERERLELESSRKIEEEQKKLSIQTAEKERLERIKEKNLQVKMEQERIDRENAALAKENDEYKADAINGEQENDNEEIDSDDNLSSSASRNKKIITWAGIAAVVFLLFFLLRNSISPNKEQSVGGIQEVTLQEIKQDEEPPGTQQSSTTATDATVKKETVKQQKKEPQVETPSGDTKIEAIKESITDQKTDDENKIYERVETGASFPGGLSAWQTYIEKNLATGGPFENGAPKGLYKVYVQFVVHKDGSVSDVKALTAHGYGMEEEAVRVIRRGPRWNPATQNGRTVNAYHKMPITFHYQ